MWPLALIWVSVHQHTSLLDFHQKRMTIHHWVRFAARGNGKRW